MIQRDKGIKKEAENSTSLVLNYIIFGNFAGLLSWKIS